MRTIESLTRLGIAFMGIALTCPSRSSAQIPQVDSLVLERTRCYGTRPAYRISVTRTGRSGEWLIDRFFGFEDSTSVRGRR